MAKELSFEQALKRLEEIVSKLEKGEISLEESIKIYEEGHQLVKTCLAKLEKAEATVNALKKDANGDFTLEPFE